MKDIAIYGAGGFGRELACLINLVNKKIPTWNIIGFFDDGVEKGSFVSHHGNVLGGMNELNAWEKDLDIAIAIGSPSSMRYVRERIVNKQVSFPNIIHPDFEIVDPETFKIGEGNIIQQRCISSCNVTIGNFNVLNGLIGLGHDDCIGDYNILMPSLHISGEVTIGNGNLIGAGTIIIQQIKIGDGVRIGAGSVLMTKPKDGCTYIGNPAKLFKF